MRRDFAIAFAAVIFGLLTGAELVPVEAPRADGLILVQTIGDVQAPQRPELPPQPSADLIEAPGLS